ncbi:EamA family transporter [Saccharothrix sp. S26]|uniref:EamA family transporter n=1 Tax=Saccharothrix sp. S26 TaxID=2907215 RepID=UPI001F1F6ECA|nr:EamA family transporter [Saccharothrix sp. S26]MCE6997436.1 EamA family transporter [Saccharothrix sp. S26]
MSAPEIEAPRPAAAASTSGPPRQRKALVAVSFAAVVLIWGSTWIAIKLAITDMPPLTASGLRFVVAGPAFIAACLALRKPLRYPSGMGWFFAFMVGCYFTVPFFLFNYGELYVSSGLASICVSSVSILMIVFSVPILRTRITTTQAAAVLVAFAALGTLIVHSQGVAVTNVIGVAALLGAAVIHALAYIMIKKHGGRMPALTLNTLPMAVGGVLLTGLGLLVERPGADAFTARSVGATIYLGVVASAIGFAVYFWLLQRMDTVIVSFAFVLFPIIAQFLAVVIEGASFGWVDLLLTLVILGAFGVTQWNQRKVLPPPATPAPVPAVDDDGRPTEAALAEVYRHVLARYPAEACGFIRASGVKDCVNVIEDRPGVYDRESRTGYAFGVDDLRELEDSFDGDDPVRVIYHSHPDAGAYFSDEDHRFAVYEGTPVYPVRHLVVDTSREEVLGSRLFDFDAGLGRYTAIATFGAPREKTVPPHVTQE